MIPDRLADTIEQGNIPVSASLELTWACNLSCLHCYQYRAGDDELTTAEIFGILDQLHEAGCLYLALLLDTLWKGKWKRISSIDHEN